MQKQNTSRSKRVRNLVVISALMAVVLTTATYAWFVGMQSVNVTSFDVEIKTTDSLQLSLDGANWDTTVAINKGNYDTASYNGNTNSWGELIPMSTFGEMDAAASRMKLFEKASLTATPGGYRLMASRVDNTDTDAKEPEGYVAFDLFVRNFSGTQYIEGLEPLDEEAIYLTVDSAARVSLDGGGVADTGIENSVRVAFTQIGRVIGTTTAAAHPVTNPITGITCATAPIDSVNVTGICRDAQIWEPNDRNHVEAAISWYNDSCKLRTASADETETDITKGAAYGADCNSDVDHQIVDGVSYPTYAVRAPISSAQRVDVYDGAAYNGYEHPTWDDDATTLLKSFPYFTDTMKMKPGIERPAFMTLAPNSITKVRVYIYIEGQDIDNYDFAQIGKAIKINFGFTKERFIEDDINYQNPPLNPEAPVITLTDDTALANTVAFGGTFTDPGFTVTDDSCHLEGMDAAATTACDAALHDDVVVNTSAVNTKIAGNYMVTYIVTDGDGNQTIKTRTVTVTPEE